MNVTETSQSTICKKKMYKKKQFFFHRFLFPVQLKSSVLFLNTTLQEHHEKVIINVFIIVIRLYQVTTKSNH